MNTCRASYCQNCAGQAVFSSCTPLNGPPPTCPPIVCCSHLTDATACRAAVSCHPVFESIDPTTCTTADCNHFAFCADGRRARCVDPGIVCGRVQPYCDPLVYVISYTETCYEGCVEPAECMH
jgi:hypothetical protein